MRNERMNRSLCLAWLSLAMVVMTTGTGQAAPGTSQSGTSSLMERLQKEEDPELAELIRTAVANHKGAGEQEIRDIARRVTQSHAQILLLDLQIAEVDRNIEATPGTEEETPRQLLQKGTRSETEGGDG
jgi:transposase